MILHAGGLFGIPVGVPDVTYDVAGWRDLLVVIALVAAACEARARRRAALGFGLLFAVLAIAFWVSALARPYGVLSDPATTRWAADVSVAGGAGGEEGFVTGEPSTAGRWASLARHIRPDVVVLLPTLCPLLIVPAAALAIAVLWPRRESTLAALLWLGGSSGALETLRGAGFVPGLWARPGPSVLWVLTLAALLAAARARAIWITTAVAAAGAALWLALGHRGPALGPVEALLAITLDQHVWLAAGLLGIWRTRDRAAAALCGLGALLALLRASGGPGDVWAGAAFVRAGLLLGTALWLDEVSPRLVSPMPEAARRAFEWLRFSPPHVPTAVALAVVLTGSLLTWWDPVRTDPWARASLEPVPEALAQAMQWLREHTPPGACVLAHDDYAAAVSVLGGRRVLRAPGLVHPVDEERRLRLQRGVFAGDPPPALRERYGLTYVFLGPGQFREEGIEEPEDLERRGGVRLAYANAKGMRLYEIVGRAGPRPGPPEPFK